LWIAVAPGPASAADESWTLLHAGALLTEPGKPPLGNSSVLVKHGRISAVLPGFVPPSDIPRPGSTDIEVIDLRRDFVLPGLIDCHTHITSEYSANARLRRLEDNEADYAIRGVVYARRTLEAGFTTVRNVGSGGNAAFALRDSINAGLIPGPRLLVAGESLSPTGGHSDGTLGYREDLFSVPGAMQGICDGGDACRAAVRSQVKRGADVIKLTATGGVLSNTAAGTEQQFFDDELRAIVETAHLLGRKVAAHGHGTRGINAALRAGVDSIEHGTFLDDESVALFVERGAYLVPTVIAGKTVEERARIPGFFPPSIAEKAKRVGPMIQGAFAKALAGGVKIAFGTDSGVSAHGENAREFAYMVEVGMSEADAIRSATVNAADLLGLSGVIGSIQEGMAADLIATSFTPLVDVTELQRVVFVMKGGVVYKSR
jgi:imidazolonepropionase-like amidohydrolase